MPDAGLVHQVNVNGPGTHLIAIGIGCYHHLPGGLGTTTKHHLGLGQLSSPPISARAVASWFIEKFDCTERPLASVSLVVSEKTPQPFENPVTGQKFETLPTGTIEEVKTALRQWITRAETNSRNSIILYFCGHGLSAGVQNYYLMRDYGEDNEDPLFGAINFRNLLSGLSTKKPSYQLLLFDACRLPNPMIELNRDGGQSIFVADPAGRLGAAETLQQCPIFATEARPGVAWFCRSAEPVRPSFHSGYGRRKLQEGGWELVRDDAPYCRGVVRLPDREATRRATGCRVRTPTILRNSGFVG